MRLIEFDYRPNNWDRMIQGYDTKTLFHETFWHDHITDIHKRSAVKYFAIKKNKEVIGYFCALYLKKNLIKISGSPLSGTGTNYMGPIVNRDADLENLIDVIDRLNKQMGIHYFETCNDVYPIDIMEKYGFKSYAGKTHKVNIPMTHDEAFKNFKSTGRNRIKKGLKNNLQAELTDDPGIVSVYFEQLKEVYGKQGMSTPYDIGRPQSLYAKLYEKDRLAPIWVKKDDEVIAAGLFPHDQNTIFFWGATSWLKDQAFCPNEVLHWHVFKYAVENGIKEYNMCGGTSRFKNKFGGNDVSHNKFTKSYLPGVDMAKNIYKKSHFLKLKLLGNLIKKRYPARKRVG